jgi:hypothetical protein
MWITCLLMIPLSLRLAQAVARMPLTLRYRNNPYIRRRRTRTLPLTMSDRSSDSYSVFDLSEFTEEDFAQIDAAVSSQIQVDDATANSSFQLDIDGLDLSSLTPEDLAQLDSAVSMKLNEHIDGPSIQIEIEDGEVTPQVVKPSPLERFRSRGIFSVSDLVSPAWYVHLTYLQNERFKTEA